MKSSRRTKVPTFETIEFNLPIPAIEAMEIVNMEGAVTIHNFLPDDMQEHASRALEQKTEQNRRFEFTDRGLWEESSSMLEAAPLSVRVIARYVTNYVNRVENLDWNPTEIVEDAYDEGEFIGNHLAYAGAIGRVAIATLDGSQELHVKNSDDKYVTMQMEPGSVTFLRGSSNDGLRQPSHYMGRAKTPRTAISIR